MKIPKEFRYPVDTDHLMPQGVWCHGDTACISIGCEEKENLCILLEKIEQPSENYKLIPEADDWVGDLLSVTIHQFPYAEYAFSILHGDKKEENPVAKRILGREQYGKLHTHVRGAFTESEKEDAVACVFAGADVRPNIPYEDLVIYAGHVRGLTMTVGKNRTHGTFKGISERISYYRNLGVNALELLPVYEFEETGKTLNYWGYGKGAYYAVKSSYASGEEPSVEFARLVKELHLAGMELILEFYFAEEIPYSYICNVLTYWAHTYHVDGFHLTGKSGYLHLLAKEPALADRKLFGMDGGCTYHDGFQKDIRRYLAGENDSVQAVTWQIRHRPYGRPVVNYAASHNGFTLMDSVSYQKKHNEANGEKNKDGTDENYSVNYGAEGSSGDRKINKARLLHMKNAMLLTLLSQGIPCILAGDECCNSQGGNNNVYCMDSDISWVNYEHHAMARKMQAFTKKALAFRAAHPVFHQAKELTGQDPTGQGFPDFSVHGEGAWNFAPFARTLHVGFMYCYEGEFYYVGMNMDTEDRLLALPKLPDQKKWYLAADTGEEKEDGFYGEGREPELESSRFLPIKAKHIRVLIGR